jgi:hypothetical protein
MANVKENSGNTLTIEDQKDIVTHGLRFDLEDKLDLTKVAGFRQFNNEFGQDFASFPISQLITEALAEEFNFILEQPDHKHMKSKGDKMITYLYRMPKKLRVALGERADKEGQSMNNILLKIIKQKIESYSSILESIQQNNNNIPEPKKRPIPRKF